MRSINCQNIRSEIEAAGSADYLSSAAMAHVNACAACETLSRQQSQLHSILANLGTVEAPGDFDFKLRARLAAEKSASGNSFFFLNFSFGARAAAVAMILLLVGAGIIYLNVSNNNQLATSNPGTPQSSFPINSVVADVAGIANQEDTVTPVEQIKSNPGIQRQFVAQGKNRSSYGNAGGTLDRANTGAPVIRANELAETYPTAPFPINASGQRLKVSVANARGGSRTISLPAVSFGSESGLSQNTTPFVASARGTW